MKLAPVVKELPNTILDNHQSSREEQDSVEYSRTQFAHRLRAHGLTLDGLQLAPSALDELLRVNPDDWQLELEDGRQLFDKFGSRLLRELHDQHEKLSRRFQSTVTA